MKLTENIPPGSGTIKLSDLRYGECAISTCGTYLFVRLGTSCDELLKFSTAFPNGEPEIGYVTNWPQEVYRVKIEELIYKKV